MKYWFFAALLANVVFLLWEFHYGAFDRSESSNVALESEEKQILTVSEAASSLTPPAAPEPQAMPSENLAGLQEQQALPNKPPMPPAGSEPALTSASPAQAEAGTQTIESAENAEVPQETGTAKEAASVPSESAPTSVTSAGEEQTATILPKTSEADAIPVQEQVTQTPQQQTDAPAEPSITPAIPEEKQQTAATVPVAADTPNQVQAVQTEHVTAQPGGESDASLSKSTMPQTAPLAAAENNANTAVQQPPTVSEPPKPEILKSACYTAGPVENAAAFEALLNRYRPQLKELEFSVTEKRKNNSYLVYYPAAATIEQSIAAAEMLRSTYGIGDLLVFREGELKGMVSLGVFSNEQRARTAQSQFEAKGVHAEIRPRYPLEIHYTVRMSWNEQQAETAQQLAATLKSRYTARRVTSACK